MRFLSCLSRSHSSRQPRTNFLANEIRPVLKRCRVSRSHPTWLEHLPQELVDRITLHLTHGKQTIEALNLTCVGSTFSQSVLTSLNDQVAVRTIPEFEQWANKHPRNGIQVDVGKILVSRETCRRISSMLRYPITHYYFHANEDTLLQFWYFQSVVNFSNLQQLSLRIDLLHMADIWHSFLSILKTAAKLKHLVLDFSRVPELALHEVYGDLPSQIAHACPNVQHLHLIHNKTVPVEPILNPLRLLSKLKNLQHATLQDEVRITSRCIKRLNKIEKVGLQGTSAVLNSATQLHKCLVEFSMPHMQPSRNLHGWHLFSSQDLNDLQICQRLQVVCISVTNEATSALADFVHALPDLEQLILRWRSPIVGDLIDPVQLDSMAFRAFRRQVCKLKKLRVLGLNDARILPSDLYSLLICVGERLERFETTITLQEEQPLDRMYLVLSAFCRSSCVLKQLVLSTSKEVLVEPTEYGRMTYWDHTREMNIVHAYISLIRRRSPTFSPRGIINLAEELLNFDQVIRL